LRKEQCSVVKESHLYCQGSAKIAEDGHVFKFPFAGVFDGISGLYTDAPKTFKGRTGGQLASEILRKTFERAEGKESLLDVLKKANLALKTCQGKEYSLLGPGHKPSAAFVAVKIGDLNTEIIQGADCFCVWEMKDGECGATPSQTFYYEQRLRDTISLLMEEHKGNRQGMWRELIPILARERKENVNSTYALINGEDDFEKVAATFNLNTSRIKRLIIFSDGFVRFSWTKDPEKMAKKVLKLHRKGGLCSVLQASRKTSRKESHRSHIDQPEATAMELEF
jgi:hypothetical protein